ncbi:MAG: hypothetical protein GF334_10095 [Candidatus Altiarchaeales archaeon]|nr:hypothetical protein [Candidatus Altiarchaeales archaeon]
MSAFDMTRENLAVMMRWLTEHSGEEVLSGSLRVGPQEDPQKTIYRLMTRSFYDLCVSSGVFLEHQVLDSDHPDLTISLIEINEGHPYFGTEDDE